MAKLVSVGKYQMTVQQKEKLIELGIDQEWVLDGLKPHEFDSIKGFGPGYVKYIRELRGIMVDPRRDLLNPDEDVSDIMGPEYTRQGPEFHPLESGMVDVRITLTLPPHQARWLEKKHVELVAMYPDDLDNQNLGPAVVPWVAEVMKADTGRHGSLSGDSGNGTMSKSQLDSLRGGIRPGVQ